MSVTVTKVCKKLGIAIDGGANTKQKAVIIREISVSHCDENPYTCNKVFNGDNHMYSTVLYICIE